MLGFSGKSGKGGSGEDQIESMMPRWFQKPTESPLGRTKGLKIWDIQYKEPQGVAIIGEGKKNSGGGGGEVRR